MTAAGADELWGVVDDGGEAGLVGRIGGLAAALALLAQGAEDGGGAEMWVAAYAVRADEGLRWWGPGGEGSGGVVEWVLFGDCAPEKA